MRSSWSPHDTVYSHVDQSPESCHVIAGFHRLVSADLSGLLLAVLGVAVLLGFLRTSLHLKLVDFLRLAVVTLLLNWRREDVGGFFGRLTRGLIFSSRFMMRTGDQDLE